MPATVAGIHLGPDTHANRPAANASGLPVGALYICSDHDIIYKTDGSTWSNWWTGAGVSEILDLPTAETDDTLVLAPDGLGGVEFRAEAGGGGGATREYLGTTTVGGTSVALTADDWIAKKITPANDCDLLSMQIYTSWVSGQVGELNAALYSDNAGVPLNIIGTPTAAIAINNLYMNNGNARWLSVPMNYELASGTSYWLAFMVGTHQTVYYDGSGTDVTRNQGSWTQDWTGSATTRNYSIRARVIR